MDHYTALEAGKRILEEAKRKICGYLSKRIPECENILGKRKQDKLLAEQDDTQKEEYDELHK